MGNLQSHKKVYPPVSSPPRLESIRLCDEALKDEILSIPDINYGVFNRVCIDWETLGRLIPYERGDMSVPVIDSLSLPSSDFQSLRRQLTSNKQRPYFTKLEGDESTSSHNLNTERLHMEEHSLDKFRQAVDMWSNLKISTKTFQKLHGVTDAWSYLDSEHIPLPQSLFGSKDGELLEEMVDEFPPSARTDVKILSQRSINKSTTSSIDSRNASDVVLQLASPVSISRTRSLQSNATGSFERDWLNYELVLRPYLSEDKKSYTYTCIVRPRCEVSSRDKTYPIDDTLVQMLGEILDPFQLERNNEHRLKVMAKIKRLLRTTSNDLADAPSPTDGAEQTSKRPMPRNSKSVIRRTADLRYLSTISDCGGLSRGTNKYRADCTVPIGIGFDDAVCFNAELMDPNKPCQPKFRRRNKRATRFGDMSDIPLLL